MRAFTLINSIIRSQTKGPTDQRLDQWTNGWTGGPTDKAYYRVASPRLSKKKPKNKLRDDFAGNGFRSNKREELKRKENEKKKREGENQTCI